MSRHAVVVFHELGCAGRILTLPGAALIRLGPTHRHSSYDFERRPTKVNRFLAGPLTPTVSGSTLEYSCCRSGAWGSTNSFHFDAEGLKGSCPFRQADGTPMENRALATPTGIEHGLRRPFQTPPFSTGPRYFAVWRDENSPRREAALGLEATHYQLNHRLRRNENASTVPEAGP